MILNGCETYIITTLSLITTFPLLLSQVFFIKPGKKTTPLNLYLTNHLLDYNKVAPFSQQIQSVLLTITSNSTFLEYQIWSKKPQTCYLTNYLTHQSKILRFIIQGNPNIWQKKVRKLHHYCNKHEKLYCTKRPVLVDRYTLDNKMDE